MLTPYLEKFKKYTVILTYSPNIEERDLYYYKGYTDGTMFILHKDDRSLSPLFRIIDDSRGFTIPTLYMNLAHLSPFVFETNEEKDMFCMLYPEFYNIIL